MPKDYSAKATWQAVLDEVMPIIHMRPLSLAELLGDEHAREMSQRNGKEREWDAEPDGPEVAPTRPLLSPRTPSIVGGGGCGCGGSDHSLCGTITGGANRCATCGERWWTHGSGCSKGDSDDEC